MRCSKLGGFLQKWLQWFFLQEIRHDMGRGREEGGREISLEESPKWWCCQLCSKSTPSFLVSLQICKSVLYDRILYEWRAKYGQRARTKHRPKSLNYRGQLLDVFRLIKKVRTVHRNQRRSAKRPFQDAAWEQKMRPSASARVLTRSDFWSENISNAI